jgi:hypothetical protein
VHTNKYLQSTRLKEEQKRKTALLAEQYELSIGEMVENQTVRAHKQLLNKLLIHLLGINGNVARRGGAEVEREADKRV